MASSVTHLLAFCVALALAAGASANLITNTSFPFENCRQNSATALYGAYLNSYETTRTGSIMCFRITVQSQQACRRASNYPRNTTRCCDVGFNKFKVYPNQACRQAVKGATILLAGQKKNKTVAVTWQTMPPPVNQFVMKITALNLSPAASKNALLCIELQAPCPTMTSFSNDPDVLEYNLYDAKLQYPYECCPAGVTDVAYFPFRPTGGSGGRKNRRLI